VNEVSLLPAAGHVEVAWRNGLGRSADIDRAPREGGRFVWRLSIATIERAAAFSPYPGYDRSFAIIAGGGAAIEFRDGETMVSRGPRDILEFAGERRCIGRPLSGATRPLNVLTRRRAARHRLSTLALDPAGEEFTAAADVTLIVCLEGAIEAASPAGQWRLNSLDSLRIYGHYGMFELTPAPDAEIALVEIDLAEDMPR